MPAPTFLILGAPKCGTTSLHHMLSRHPDVFMPRSKDPLFFELDAEYRRGPGFYRQCYFVGWKGERASGEARPTKLMLPFVPARVRRCLPDARLIAILRDPADRAFSHWWMRRCNGLESRSLEEALRLNAAAIEAGRSFEGEAGVERWREHLDGTTSTAPVYLEFGYYASQLERWLAHFPRERIDVVFFDDLSRDPEGVLRDLFGFIGVDAARHEPGRTVYNAGLPRLAFGPLDLDRRLGLLSRAVPERIKRGVKELLARWGSPPRMEATTRRWLVAHYDSQVRALEALTGRDLTAWRSER